MADEERKIIVDQDWKEEAKREKQRLAEEASAKGSEGQEMPEASFVELLNLIATQALVAMGGFSGPGGQQLPPNPEAAKFFIDMLQMVDEKTQNNLSTEEKTLLDRTLYELRMRFVQTMSGGGEPGAGGGQPGPGGGQPGGGQPGSGGMGDLGGNIPGA